MYFFHFFYLALGLFLTSYLPGRALLSFVKWHSDEKFAGSFGVSFFLFYLIGFSGYIFKQQAFQFNVVFLIPIILISIIILLIKSAVTRQELFQLGAFFCCFIIVVFFQTFLPIYSGGLWSFDWWEHYQRSIFYLDKLPLSTHFGPYLLTARPPVFNVVSFFFQSFIGRDFWQFQIISTLLNVTLLLPCYLLVKQFSQKKSAFLFAFVTLFFLLNPSFIIETTFTWSKAITASYVLLGLYCYLRFFITTTASYLFFTALFLGIGQLTHYSATPYIIIIFSHLLFKTVTTISVPWKKLGIFTGIFFLTICSWYLWAIANFGLHETFFGNTTFQQNYSTVQQLLYKEINMTSKTLLPLLSPGYMHYINTQSSLWVKIYDGTFAIYATTVPGQITMALCFVLFFMRKKIKRHTSFLLYFCLVGIMLGIIVTPGIWPTGIAQATMLPISSLLISLALAYHFSLRKKNRKLFYGLLFCSILEACIGIGLRLFIFRHDLNPSYFMHDKNVKVVQEHKGNYLLKKKSDLQFLYDVSQ